MRNESPQDDKPSGGTYRGLRYAFLLAVLGLVVAAGAYQLQHRQKTSSPLPQVKPQPAPVFHTRVTDIPEDTPTILIGLASKGHVLLDASMLCSMPLFRERSDIVPTTETATVASFLASAPDVDLPPRLRDTQWSIVSRSPMVWRLSATQAYQWLSPAYAPLGNHCLFIGQPMASFSPYGRLDLDQVEPVVALSVPAHSDRLYLKRQKDMQDVDTRSAESLLEQYPWLAAYQASKLFRCEDAAVQPKQLKVVAVALRVEPDSAPVPAWLVTSQCEDPMFYWALVITTPDAGFEMVTMEGIRGAATEFFPQEAWVVDVNGDGLDELLIKAQYYEGESYRLLRVVQSDKGTHALRQMASSAYYGL